MLFFLIKFKRDLSLRIKLIKLHSIKSRKFSKIKVKNKCQLTISQLLHKIRSSYISIRTLLKWEINPKILKEAKESSNMINRSKSSKFKKFKSKSNSNNNKWTCKVKEAIKVILKEVETKDKWSQKLILCRATSKRVNFS